MKACCGYLALVAATAVLFAICSALPTAESPLYKAVRQSPCIDENRHGGCADAPADVAALLREGTDPEDGLRAAVPLIGGLLHAESPLLRAAANGRMAVVEALSEAGARPEAGDTTGPLGALVSTTPLYWAAFNGHTAAVEALLEAGAQPEAVETLFFGLVPGRSCTRTRDAWLSGDAQDVRRELSEGFVVAVVITAGLFVLAILAQLFMVAWRTPEARVKG